MNPSSFYEVLKDELAYVQRRRFGTGSPKRVKEGLVGLALSGGGIRSATTNLGILQTLSCRGVLPLVDYICTVSGGGYIGSCLSSLLSLDDQTPPGVLAPGARPMFTTEWPRFPFNPDAPHGDEQIRHLRTHGSFLVTRRGAFKRETLRSVGQLLSGTVYHIVLALLMLSAAALLYMTVFFLGSPDVDRVLRYVTEPVRTYSSAFEASEDTTERPRYTPGSVTELSGNNTVAYRIPVVYVYPGLLDRLEAKLMVLVGLARQIPPQRLRAIVGSTLAVGALAACVSFVYLRRCKDNLRIRPKPGESESDAVAVHALRLAGWGTLAAVLAWVLGVLSWIHVAHAPLWLLLPIVAIAGVRITAWLLHVVMPRLRGAWTRDMRSLWGAYEATAVYAMWGAALFGAFPILVYALREHTALIGISGVISLIAARLLTLRNGVDRKKRPIATSVLRALLAIAIGVGLLLIVVTICAFIVPDAHSDAMWVRTGIGAAAAGAGIVLLGIVGDANRLSPHYFYRDRLAEAYLFTDRLRDGTTSLETLRDNVEMKLTELHGVPRQGVEGHPGRYRRCRLIARERRDLG